MNGVLEQVNSLGRQFAEFGWPMLIQSSALITILLLVDLLLRKKVRAVFRYWIWMLVLVKLLLSTTLWSPVSVGNWVGDKLAVVPVSETAVETGGEKARLNTNTEPVLLDEPISGEVDNAVAPARTADVEQAAPVAAARTAETVTPVTWQAVVFLIWVVVVLALGLLLAQRAMFVCGLVRQAKEVNGLMNDTLRFCCKLMGVKPTFGLKVSANATSPAVCGLFRPVILVPANLGSTLGAEHLRMVLLHELAHIRRGDLWVNLVQTLLQIVYFYNPLLWLANWMIRRVREQAVDEAVQVALGEKAGQYPETLLNVAKFVFERPAMSLRLVGVVESKNALAGRIKRMLNRPVPKSAKLGILGSLAIILFAVLLLPMAKAKDDGTVDNYSTVTVKESAGIDVRVEDFDIWQYPEGGLYTATVSIRNKGAEESPKFGVDFYRGDPNVVKPMTHEAGQIKPGKVWNKGTMPFALKEGTNEITVVLDPANLVEESNEANNRASMEVVIKDGQVVEKKVSFSSAKNVNRQGMGLPEQVISAAEFGGGGESGNSAGKGYEELLGKAVTVDVNQSPDGDRLTVQYAATAVCEAAGVPYQWDKSQRHAREKCRRYIEPVRIKDTPAGKAIAEILKPHGLAYGLDVNGLYLLEASQRSSAKPKERAGQAEKPSAAAVKVTTGKRDELSHDDGSSDGKESINGGGHAVMFDSPDEGYVLRSVKIYGSRYGEVQPPKEDFHIYLCDEKFNIIKDFAFPYSQFVRGNARWVTLRVEPVEVPSTFAICVDFKPHQTKGVYVHYDANSSGNSYIGVPGQEFKNFSEGEWMIRAVVGQGQDEQVDARLKKTLQQGNGSRVAQMDLLERYPTTLTGASSDSEEAHEWEFTAQDIFRLSGFSFSVGDALRVEIGPADVGIGHCTDGAVWAVVIPQKSGTLKSLPFGEPEIIDHLWLRFHPREVTELFAKETVSTRGDKELWSQMNEIAAVKIHSSWQSDGKALIPGLKNFTVDADIKNGVRRFFAVDREAKTAEYVAAFESHTMPAKKAKAGPDKIYTVTFKPIGDFKPKTAFQLLGAFNKNHPPEAVTHHFKVEAQRDTLVGRINVDGEEGKDAVVRMLKESKELALVEVGAASSGPVVVKTNPEAFANDVSVLLKEIAVTFDQAMMDGSWSWTGGGDMYPKTTGRPGYDANKKTCSLPVELEQGKVYWVGINSPSYQNFKSASGVSAKRYVILFATRGSDGKPTLIPEDMLREARAINEQSGVGMTGPK
jgi:beta-lactamase regulating signal transducer with metallopeptidase domain